MTAGRNVLFIVMDQFRADCAGTNAATGANSLAAAARMPNLDAFRENAVSFDRHYAVTSPCGPSRASLLTGLYAMTHRAVRNGTPLADGIANVATEARRSGYEPLLFGCTDAGPDPRGRHPRDPDLRSYERVMPGFREIVELRLAENFAWQGHLVSLGYDLPDYEQFFVPREFDPDRGPRPDDPAFYAREHSDTAFLTDAFLNAMGPRSRGNWFAHLTYLRPHPPLIAPEPYNRMFRAESMPPPNRMRSREAAAELHPFVAVSLERDLINGCVDGSRQPLDDADPEDVGTLRAVYLGLASEIDFHLGRVFAFLKETGQDDDTLIIVTADHGEMLGDHYLWGKDSFHDAAYHVPLIIRDPDHPEAFGTRVTAFTESVDVAPTILDWIGGQVPAAMDGRSLIPFLADPLGVPLHWRDHVYADLDFGEPDVPTVWQEVLGLPLREANLAIIREDRYKLVHFNGGLEPLLFDMHSDMAETRNLAGDPAHGGTLLRLTRKLLDHRMRHQDHRLSDMKLTPAGTVNLDN